MHATDLHSFYQDKEVLITGGCGSIGSEIVRQLLSLGVRIIKVFDNDEESHFNLQHELQSDKLRHLLGDVRNKSRLDFAMKNVDIVFHAAALKHVPLCEYNPFEAMQTNVIGTQNALDSARENRVGHFVFISTDKAVNPINTMGATKLLGEKLTLNADLGDNITKFSCVRFGNVLGSSGSVLPIFARQIIKGGPVTLTSPKMTRFCMSIRNAVSLILRVPPLMQGKDIFILKMNALKVKDLAEALVEELAPRHGHDPASICITEIGVRPGEKLHESLIGLDELPFVRVVDDMYVIHSKSNVPYFAEKLEESPTSFDSTRFSSELMSHLSKDEIKEFLKREGML